MFVRLDLNSSHISTSTVPIRTESQMPPAKRQCVVCDTTSDYDRKNSNVPEAVKIENFYDGETVHQRCVIIKGHYADLSTASNTSDFMTVKSTVGSYTSFPTQTWPIAGNRFKASALLSPGANKLEIQRTIGNTVENKSLFLTLNYIPLLQTPALHLAIMVAKDSPLAMDCPPVKYGPMSTAHSSLEAAIAKMRMSAYMWQALTAEDMRMKGLGRRAFRLEEDFGADTTSSAFFQYGNQRDADSVLEDNSTLRVTAKVHVIRSSKTLAEIRDVQVAQQNRFARNRNRLFDFFLDALAKHGSPFEASSHPVVAGMILDSHYSISQKLILGHAALGCHDPTGVSLGMMGSHLTYSFPRFLEEISTCLLDTRAPGTTVGNDNNECDSLWEACAVGQGAFLHEVGHAFGAPHTTGIMARGYPRHWARNFLARTAYAQHTKEEGIVVDNEAANDARWDTADALSFQMLPHFWLPGDVKLSAEARFSAPTVSIVNPDTADAGLRIACPAHLASVEFSGQPETPGFIGQGVESMFCSRGELERRFGVEEELTLRVVGMNGKSKTIRNVWKLFSASTFIRIPGSEVILRKRSVITKDLEESDGAGDEDDKFWSWATLLTKKGPDGKVMRASDVDVRTGCVLDGAYVEFPDGTKVNCGPRIDKWGGRKHEFGGHAAEKVNLPVGQELVKVEVAREQVVMAGMRIYLNDGTAGGQLLGNGPGRKETLSLEPDTDENIIGFYGRNWWGPHFSGVVEFGIITAQKDIELPDEVYRMKELQNTDGGHDAFRREHGYGEDEKNASQTEDEEMSL